MESEEPMQNGVVLRTLGRGEYFGEQALLREEKRSANVVALSPGCECLTLDRESFLQLIGNLSEFKQYLKNAAPGVMFQGSGAENTKILNSNSEKVVRVDMRAAGASESDVDIGQLKLDDLEVIGKDFRMGNISIFYSVALN
jgi:CRP-like cAMP-binding protein